MESNIHILIETYRSSKLPKISSPIELTKVTASLVHMVVL